MRPHVLAICERWRAGRPECGISMTQQSVLDVLDEVDCVTYGVAHYDASQWRIDGQIIDGVDDCRVVRYCLDRKPDLVYFMRTPHGGSNPHPLTLAFIRQILAIPMMAMWGDLDGDDIRMIDAQYPLIDVNVSTDHCPIAPHTKRPERFLYLWFPCPSKWACDPGLERDIPVSFVGSLSNDGGRRQAVDALRGAGIDVWAGGGRGEEDLPLARYYEILQRSQITLDFSSSQLKARAFEALHCGALLLEPSHVGLHRYFDPGTEYMPYDDLPDLIRKVQYYVTHDAERIRIARRGHERCVRECDAASWWTAVLRAIRDRVPTFMRDEEI